MTTLNDLSDEQTRMRQRKMMLALRRTGHGSYIDGELPEIRLHLAFCQWIARDLRLDAHRRAKLLLAESRDDEWLSFVTWVPADATSDSPLPWGPGHRVGKFALAAAQVQASAIVGATEIDYDLLSAVWQESVHAILRHPRRLSRPQLSSQLAAALCGSNQRSGRIYRPLVVKPVTNLDGALSYVYKGFAVLSTTQRSTWRDPSGGARAVKQALRKPQLQQLLAQTARDGVADRALIGRMTEAAR